MNRAASKARLRAIGNRALLALAPFLASSAAVAQHSPIKSDEQVSFFPTVGQIEVGTPTVLPIHGWIYEPETDSIRRNLLLKSLCRALTLVDNSCSSDLFKNRARFFLVDNESGKAVPLVAGAARTVSERSGSEGHFRAELTLNASELPTGGPPRELRYSAVMRPGDDRVFEGRVLLLERFGISVISDIDDTVKVSNVLNRQELLLNSFLRPYKAVEGMPELYRLWAERGASFHYLSASPWQLYPALQSFFDDAKLPTGSFHMKLFRWKDSRFFDLFISPELYKVPILERMLEQFPDRRFVMVGDSGERDIEIYGGIARRFPSRDIRIVIRELSEARIDTARRDVALEGVRSDRWRIITDETLKDETGRADLTDFISRELRP